MNSSKLVQTDLHQLNSCISSSHFAVEHSHQQVPYSVIMTCCDRACTTKKAYRPTRTRLRTHYFPAGCKQDRPHG